jgi:predicted nucleotide-binding protein (sugar kinase/HSP70/actin superfamily)
MIADESAPGLGQTRCCPYCEAVPALLEAFPSNGKPGRLAAPVIDLRLSDRDNAYALARALAPWVRLRLRDVERALAAGHALRRRIGETMCRAGAAAMEKLAASGRPGLVVVGRSYTVFDDGLNQEIPALIADAGGTVIPMDALPFRPDLLTGDYRNVFWASGQRIMSALLQIAQTPNLYAVYMSSFGCGPDSFLLSFAEAVMTGKPFLSLELDDHGSSGGYRTRVEAFMDVVRGDLASGRTRSAAIRIPGETQDPERVRKLELCFPPMHPVGARLLAAGFRSGGYIAVTLPDCDAASFAEGRRWVRGSECLPAPLTLGSFLRHTRSRRETGGSPCGTALFMPTADGPCRFGQYRALFRLVLDGSGMAETPIFSPSSENAYHGLDDRVVRRVMQGIFAGDILFKMRCRTAPYQRTRGDTEELLERWTRRLEQALEQPRQRLGPLLAQAGEAFARISVRTEPRPLVGIVGEVFVRVTPHANAHLVETIEELGGEAWLAPVGEWVLYTAWVERYRLGRHRAGLGARLGSAVKFAYLSRMERRMYRSAGPLLARRREPPVGAVVREGARYVPPDFEGESIITMGRTILFAGEGASLVVNCAPFGCMHGALTTALFEQTGQEIGVPVVNVFYDGFTDNSVLVPFLHDAVMRGATTVEGRRGDRRP